MTRGDTGHIWINGQCLLCKGFYSYPMLEYCPARIRLTELGVNMPTVCIHCNLRAFVEGRAPVVFEESIAEHMRVFHPDPEATKRERAQLEKRATELLGIHGPEGNGDDAA